MPPWHSGGGEGTERIIYLLVLSVLGELTVNGKSAAVILFFVSLDGVVVFFFPRPPSKDNRDSSPLEESGNLESVPRHNYSHTTPGVFFINPFLRRDHSINNYI